MKDENGLGTVEVFVYLARRERKFITIGKCKRDEFEAFCNRKDVQYIVKRYKEVIAALPVMNLESTVGNFNAYFYEDEEEKEEATSSPKNLYKGVDQNTDFIAYMQKVVNEEQISKGTRRHKQCTIEALRRFGQIKTFAAPPCKVTVARQVAA